MRIGYACLAIGVPGSGMKTCRLADASEERLPALIEQNLAALEILIDYNISSDIKLFRISSDIIPFGSGVAANFPWESIFAADFERIGTKIRAAGMRVSMHPGQYTVLNSPHPAVVERSIEDLRYHARFLDALALDPTHKLVLHLGGAYGDKTAAKARFAENYARLDDRIRQRLVLENDDSLFNIADVLETAARVGMPVVYDTLHNQVNPADTSKDDLYWIAKAAATWQEKDGVQKIHYSQQDPSKRAGAHSATIDVVAFLRFYRQVPTLNIDIMLEVKDKNVSAIKCLNCVENRGMKRLEEEWARYKYLILEHSAAHYMSIRQLLKNKEQYPALEMYRLIEEALAEAVTIGGAQNAAQHVWGYFKHQATTSEKARFDRLLTAVNTEDKSLATLKRHLLKLAAKYNETYLLKSYYLTSKVLFALLR